jgi:hypothetical protein
VVYDGETVVLKERLVVTACTNHELVGNPVAKEEDGVVGAWMSKWWR